MFFSCINSVIHIAVGYGYFGIFIINFLNWLTVVLTKFRFTSIILFLLVIINLIVLSTFFCFINN